MLACWDAFTSAPYFDHPNLSTCSSILCSDLITGAFHPIPSALFQPPYPICLMQEYLEDLSISVSYPMLSVLHRDTSRPVHLCVTLHGACHVQGYLEDLDRRQRRMQQQVQDQHQQLQHWPPGPQAQYHPDQYNLHNHNSNPQQQQVHVPQQLPRDLASGDELAGSPSGDARQPPPQWNSGVGGTTDAPSQAPEPRQNPPWAFYRGNLG